MFRDTQTAQPIREVSDEAKAATRAAGLVYVSDDQPGIRRVRNGSGFRYLRAGKPVRDRTVLRRIRKLAVPPAYADVWICAHPRGHIQATGRDARRRKQYRYHEEWRATRDTAKFDRMVDFGAALPRLRAQLRRDLSLPGLPRAKVLALVVMLLDRTRIRVGNEEYARSNKSYGLTTLRNRHVKFLREGRALLRFHGKGGIEHEVKIDDKRLVAIVRKLEELPGQLLFQYLGDDDERHPVDSTLVNEYLREAMGQEFTAKDFRTWNATVLALQLLRATPLPDRRTERAMKTCITSVVKQVAEELRNTPAVCRKSYINPEVFNAWREDRLPRAGRPLKLASHSDELTALRFLKSSARTASK